MNGLDWGIGDEGESMHNVKRRNLGVLFLPRVEVWMLERMLGRMLGSQN